MKKYRILNWTVFGLLCYIAALPVIARVMRFLLPGLWRCSYRSMTGRPCPFCGTTVTPYLAAFVLAEFAWRIVLLLRRKSSPHLPWWDLAIHIALLALLLGSYLACWD